MTENYRHTLDALGLCVSAGIPAILWGNPGEGKTSMIESAAQNAGWMVETVILSQSEPSDLAGLPIVSGDGTSSSPARVGAAAGRARRAGDLLLR